MFQYAVSNLKFFIKRGVGAIRSLLLFFNSASVNTSGYEGRMLIVNLEGMGDLIVFTSVLKHYKKRFPDRKIFLLIKAGTGIDGILRDNFVDEVIAVPYRKFSLNPFFGFLLINKLRRIGFRTVINHDFSASEIMGKIISVELGAPEVVGYRGLRIEFEKPNSIQQEKHLRLIESRILPRYTKLIPSLKSDCERDSQLPSMAESYVAIYEAVTGAKEDDYTPELPATRAPEWAEKSIRKFGLEKNKYVILNINSSVTCKSWPPDRFIKAVKFLAGQGLTIAAIGSKSEFARVSRFVEDAGIPIKNLAGQTSFEDLIALVQYCFLVFANDTSTIHVAVALKKPSLGVSGGGQFGVSTGYGYKDITIWAYKKTPCYNDNWRCSREVPYGMPSPCVAAVTLEMVLEKLQSLTAYLRQTDSYPREKFRIRF
jgi:ADP-heptose:LPS heptosyltransferase